MKIKKILISIIGSFLFLTAPCMANEISVSQDISTSKVTVEANLGETFKSKRLMMYCLLDQGSISEIPNETDSIQKTDKLYAISYGEADATGKCVFSDIVVNGDSSRYVFYVTVSGNDRVFKSEAVYVVNANAITSFLSAINNASGEAILTLLNDEVENKTIGLNIALYKNLNDDGRAQAADKLKNRTYEDIEKAVEEINRASVKVGIEHAWDAKALDVLLYPDDYAEIADFKEIIKSENGMDAYKDNLAITNLSKLDASSRIDVLKNALSIANADSLFDKITISVINNEISTCDGYADVTGVIESYYKNGILSTLDFAKYNASKYRNNLNKELLTKKFSAVSELISYIESYIKNAEDNSTPSTPPSGGGGGGGGGGKPVNTPTPVIKPDAGLAQPVVDSDSGNVVFYDMTGYEWAMPAVKYLGEKGIVSGKENGVFDPSGYITREEFVKIIVCAFEIEEVDEITIFSDVASDAWYKKYIASAVKAGIVSGISDGMFGTGKNITRQDVAVIASRALSAPSNSVTTSFTDNESIADYAKSAVAWMCEQGYIGGYEDKSFRPVNFCTRAEAARIIYEIIK